MNPERRIGVAGGSSKGGKAENFGFSDPGMVGDKRKSPHYVDDALGTDQADFQARRNKTHLKARLADGHKGLAHGLVFGQMGVQVSFQIDVGDREPSVQRVATNKANGAHGAQRSRSKEAAEAGTGVGNGH